MGRKALYLVCGVVKLRDKPGYRRKQQSEYGTGRNAECNELAVGVHRLLVLPRSEQISDHDADGRTHCKEHDVKQVGNGIANVGRSDDGKSPRGDALSEKRHSRRPHDLVHKQRQTLLCDLQCESGRKLQSPVHSLEERGLFGVSVRPRCNERKLHKSGDDRRKRSTLNAHRRSAELSEYEDVVKDEVCHDSSNACDHGAHRLPRLSEGRCVHLRHRKGRKPPHYHIGILLTVAKRQLKVSGAAALVQEQVDDRLVKGAYHEKSKRKHGGGDVYLEAENAAYTVVVALSGKLCGEYSRSRQSTEYCEVIYEYHLVCDRNAGHLLGAESADHQVVEHRHELRYSVLHHDRYCYCKRHFVKLLCSDKRSDFHLVSDFRKFCGIVMIY